MQKATIPSTRIKEIVEEHSLSFQPVADNRTWTSNPAVRRAKGDIANVPILIGSNSQEGRSFVRGQNDRLAYALKTFGNDTNFAKKIVDEYPVGEGEFSTGFDAVAQIMTDFTFQCVSFFEMR